MATSLKLDVFGRHMLIEWFEGGWQAYLLGVDGKRSPLAIPIPAFVTEDELAQYLDDLYHESATPRHPAVVRLS